ncbi:glycosyltransferase family 2 protein [Paraburkholderia bryophila]|uniref:glycosyltransferase family 2 protein n=1 Tax=Paraburkholderia bryophila TaxID=420952 RepID=UPI00234B9A89|nr:glycosyltransferase family 2 protein [Paraburkholderia bryophila]WCM20554.1 glycosyltransferase family 2 protein [Paraburkholderia bryophila]
MLLNLLARLLRGFREAVQLRGGVLPVLCVAASLLRREGLAGLRSRLTRSGAGGGYRAWIAQYDTLDAEMREALKRDAGELWDKPLISIVVPVHNTPVQYLTEMLDSVLAQIYPHWELCIADDASSAPHVAKILSDYAARDARIKSMRRSTNGHICVASNDALALASGRFIALLDHDDVLPAHALFMVARYVNRNPSARMLYSDEDKLAPGGQRAQPYFKSDWNAALMLGQNMFSHLGILETALVKQVGGFRPGFEGSQDHDLVLRCAELAGEHSIVHIPHVLYHWRVIAGSTARDVAAKPYARDASLRAVTEHLERCGLDARVEPLSADSTMLRVIYRVPRPAPLVSIIIPTRDRAELLSRCVDSLRERTSYPNYEILIVDNGSVEPGALELLERYARLSNVTVMRIDAPFNYSMLNNAAAARAKGSLLCLLNNDVEIESPDWLDILCGYALLPACGAVGAALWYPDDRLQHGGVQLGIGDFAGHMHHLMPRGDRGYFGRAVLAQHVSAISAACLVVKKSLFDAVGGLDEEHLAVAFNDVDFCLKLRAAGYENTYVPYAELYHHESASRGSDLGEVNAKRFLSEAAFMHDRWQKMVEDDPYYNPNLATSGGPLFSLAFPPRVGQFA